MIIANHSWPHFRVPGGLPPGPPSSGSVIDVPSFLPPLYPCSGTKQRRHTTFGTRESAQELDLWDCERRRTEPATASFATAPEVLGPASVPSVLPSLALPLQHGSAAGPERGGVQLQRSISSGATLPALGPACGSKPGGASGMWTSGSAGVKHRLADMALSMVSDP